MVVSISRIFRLSVMVKLGKSIMHDKCISQEELAQIDCHGQKTVFFLKEQHSSISRIYGGTLSGGGIYGGHYLMDISTFGDGQAGSQEELAQIDRHRQKSISSSKNNSHQPSVMIALPLFLLL